MTVKLPTTILRYGVTLIAVVVVLLITMNIYYLVDRVLRALLFPAVIFAARYGGGCLVIPPAKEARV